MGIAIKVEHELALKRLKGIEERAANLRAWSVNFGQYMRKEIDRNFAVGGRPRRWPPLKAGSKSSWLGRRRSHWGKGGWRSGRLSGRGRAALRGRLPLTDTGLMRRSIHAIPGSRSTKVVCADWKGAIHQCGARTRPRVIRPRRKKALAWPYGPGPVRRVNHPGSVIPPRPFLVFLPENLAYARATLPRFVAEGRVR